MKKVHIYANQNEESACIEAQLVKKLQKAGILVVSAEEKFEYLITIGGDGTLLSAFHQFIDLVDSIQFIGIHTGHLGFYADWQSYEVEELVKGLSENEPSKVVSYPLLQVEVTEEDGKVREFYALNECSVRSNFGTMVSDIYIKDSFFETLRSDGLCVATPTGSTGLSKSLGGAVIHPRLDALQLTEMASLNNRIYRSLGSPLIIAKDECFAILPTIKESDSKFTLMYDNQTIPDITIKSVKMKIAEKRIRFANIRHTHFWDRVEASFIGRHYQSKKSFNNLLK